MEKIWAFVIENPLAFIFFGFIAVVVLYFFLKQLVKLALIFLIILLALGGYYYFKDPANMPRNMVRTIKTVKETIVRAPDKIKEMYRKGENIIKKGKEILQDPEEAFKPATNGKEKR